MSDGVGFNDPDAWGFCRYCAFFVAVADGVMLAHERRSGGWSMVRCYGSLMDPTDPPGPEARPIPWADALAEGDGDE